MFRLWGSAPVYNGEKIEILLPRWTGGMSKLCEDINAPGQTSESIRRLLIKTFGEDKCWRYRYMDETIGKCDELLSLSPAEIAKFEDGCSSHWIPSMTSQLERIRKFRDELQSFKQWMPRSSLELINIDAWTREQPGIFGNLTTFFCDNITPKNLSVAAGGFAVGMAVRSLI